MTRKVSTAWADPFRPIQNKITHNPTPQFDKKTLRRGSLKGTNIIELLTAVALIEFIDSSRCINQYLFSCEEWV